MSILKETFDAQKEALHESLETNKMLERLREDAQKRYKELLEQKGSTALEKIRTLITDLVWKEETIKELKRKNQELEENIEQYKRQIR